MCRVQKILRTEFLLLVKTPQNIINYYSGYAHDYCYYYETIFTQYKYIKVYVNYTKDLTSLYRQ